MDVKDLKERYVALLHGVQTGIMYKMEFDSSDTTPKHLRTGINSSIIQSSALCDLLIKKGIITEQEYWESAVNMAFEEVKG